MRMWACFTASLAHLQAASFYSVRCWKRLSLAWIAISLRCCGASWASILACMAQQFKQYGSASQPAAAHKGLASTENWGEQRGAAPLPGFKGCPLVSYQ